MQYLVVLLQLPITGLGISNFEEKKSKKKIVLKSQKLHISETTRVWAVILGTPENTLTAPKHRVRNFKFFILFCNLSFPKIFEKIKNRRISYTKKIWAVLIGHQNCNHSVNSDRIPLLGCFFKTWWSNQWIQTGKSKKNLNHCNIRYSLNVKESFVNYQKVLRWKSLNMPR